MIILGIGTLLLSHIVVGIACAGYTYYKIKK